jgi:hypothetical protein
MLSLEILLLSMLSRTNQDFGFFLEEILRKQNKPLPGDD